jgi:hypothetical protein
LAASSTASAAGRAELMVWTRVRRSAMVGSLDEGGGRRGEAGGQ